MKIIRCLLFSIALLSGVSVEAVTARLTGNWVGAEGGTYIDSYGDEQSYWAGIVELDIDGNQYMAMPMLPFSWNPTDYMGISSEVNLYTRDDILAGGTNTLGEFINGSTGTTDGTEGYARASWFFLNGLLGYEPPDPLWAASFNEMVWQTVIAVPLLGTEEEDYFDNANTIYDVGSGATLRDMYEYDIANGLDPNYDYSGFMHVLEGNELGNEFLVFTSPVPVPAALWLFVSGLIGFVVVARKNLNLTGAGHDSI